MPKKTRKNIRWRERLRHLHSHYCQRPGDLLKIATPFRVPWESPFVAAVLEKMRKCFPATGQPLLCGHGPEHPYNDYDNMMDLFRKQVNVCGLGDAFVNPECFTLIPFHVKNECLMADSVSRVCNAQLIFVGFSPVGMKLLT